MQILLFCYRFPPNPGIGGRRWAKFAKELARREITVHTVCVEPDAKYTATSAWQSDVRSDRIHIHFMPRRFPAAFDRQFFGSLSMFDRIQIRVWRKLLPFITRGSPLDRTVFWRSGVRELTKRLVDEHGIRTVIATGAPFRYMVFLAEMRADGEIAQLLCDFRDPWVEAQAYGMCGLSTADARHEADFEAKVYRHADYLMAPNQYLIRDQKCDFEQPERRVILRHPYDPDDILTEGGPAPSGGAIKLTYAGGLYHGLEPALEGLASGLGRIRMENPALFCRIECIFYTPDHTYSSLFSGVSEAVEFRETIPAKAVMAELQASTYTIFLTAEHTKNWKTTKYAELLAIGRPILTFGPKGELAQDIEYYQVGHALKPESIPERLAELLARSTPQTAPPSEYIKAFSLASVTDELIELFNV